MALAFVGIVFVVFLLLGTPVSFCIGIASMTTTFVDPGIPSTQIATKLVTGIDTFPLLAGVFFILAGELMSQGSITRRLVAFCKIIIGRIRGASAQVAILTSVFFAGISGAAVADLAAVGSMLTPAMKEEGYDDAFATVVPVAASVVGPIIPPSNIMIIYAMTTNASVGAMFLGGILPGVMIGLMLMVFTYILAVKRKYPKNTDPRPPLVQLLRTVFVAVPVLVMPLIIMVGVLSGVFTASESGNIAAVYALLLSVFVFKDYGFRELYRIFVNAAVTVSTCLLVLSTATGLAWILAVNQIPQMLLDGITSLTANPYVFLLLVNIVLLGAGMFLDPGAAIILLAPVLTTMGVAYGIHPLHLSMVVCLNLTLGVVTPPVGVCLYVGAGIGKVPIDRVVRQILPFVLLEFAAVLLVTYFPPISTTIPRLFGLYYN